MGDKSKAREKVKELCIPLAPSISGNNLNEISAQVSSMKFPLIIKAVAGGGGKGMKIIYSAAELPEAWETAKREAKSYFGNSQLYLEQYIEDARHIEVQILGDNYGNIVHLYDRECTIQRRHQKIIEEAPSITLPAEIRQKLLETAVYIAKSINYTNAGTIEFIFDKDLNFYFLEMNTRIQVEHPITEAITGIDIVKEQIRISEGKSLSFHQKDIIAKGHSIECRIYAEDPFSGFLPAAGEILLYNLPASEGIRIDSSFGGNATVLSSFDPMIAKVISHSDNRLRTISMLNDYLKKCSIQGIKTNLEYLTEIIEDKDYIENNISTHYCDLKTEELFQKLKSKKDWVSPVILIAAILAKSFSPKRGNNIWESLGSWRNICKRIYSIGNISFEVYINILATGRISFSLSNQEHLISGIQNQEHAVSFLIDNVKYTCLVTKDSEQHFYISFNSLDFTVQRADLTDLRIFSQNGKSLRQLNGNQILSPLNGKVIKLNVKEGDKVQKGELLLIIESMKMENKITAPFEAVINKILVSSGDHIKGNELIMNLSILN